MKQISLVKIILFCLQMTNCSFQSALWKRVRWVLLVPKPWKERHYPDRCVYIYMHTHIYKNILIYIYTSWYTKNSKKGLQALFVVNSFHLLLAENNRNKLQLVQLCWFGADMPTQVADCKKPQSVVLYFSKQLTKNVNPVHPEFSLAEEQWNCKAHLSV